MVTYRQYNILSVYIYTYHSWNHQSCGDHSQWFPVPSPMNCYDIMLDKVYSFIYEGLLTDIIMCNS